MPTTRDSTRLAALAFIAAQDANSELGDAVRCNAAREVKFPAFE